MICAHCNEPFSWWRSLSIPRLDGGFKCPVCGKVQYLKAMGHRPDSIGAFVVLGYFAVVILLLFLAPEKGMGRYLALVGWIAVAGLIAITVPLMVRASRRIIAVTSLPPRDLRRNRRFHASGLVYLFSISGYYLTHWLHIGEEIGFAVMMISNALFVAAYISIELSRMNPLTKD